ncbi:MAG TPA: patatin-like phospholipase family protein [Chitinophagaceae bacterium]|nr:patatin-like phospholipase family protein [Chitinophagaceae bacterium]
MVQKEPIPVDEFLRLSGADKIVEELKLHFKNKQLVVSDLTDDQGHQYVDLVQEGGGVLGVALVGYTYVLEKMGIRFFSLAGTSAGSINSMLLACTGNKEDEKVEKIIADLLALDFFSLVDGKSTNWKFTKKVKSFVQKLLVKKNFFKRISSIAKWLLISLFLLTIISFIANFFIPGVSKWIGLAAGVIFLLVTAGLISLKKKFQAFSKNGYGLNEGKVFHEWIKKVISNNHVQADPADEKISTMAGFARHFMRVPPGLQLKHDPRRAINLPPDMPMLTIITCDIVSERKIEFPNMWDLYWARQEDVHPGDFVRASMSIPVFFETYTLTDLRKKSSFAIWDKHLNWQNENKKIPDKAQFIDGGTLSNFPINVFYNPNFPVPRMPTLGIRLQDGILDSVNRSNNTFLKYLKSFFSTLRFHFDRDFITKNRAYNFGVKLIDVKEHSWLNFFMEDKEKVELFRKGARAAADFLRQFDWEKYKEERLRNFEMREERFADPNNVLVSSH